MVEFQKPPRHKILIVLGLSAVVLVVFWQVQTFKLVHYDDDSYVAGNHRVLSGLTGESILWAFVNADAGFWHPLTWLSLMLDYEMHGYRPGGYHWTNVLLHLSSVLLLFFVLARMTGALWKSAFVAALFALHPLQVEPVAWVSQRKDMLSTFFMMLTLLAYCRYAEKPGPMRYLYVVLFFALGLMSKPMIVTLPFAMLLLDWWPMGRFQIQRDSETERIQDALADRGGFSVLSPSRLVYEKLPLIFLAVIASVLVLVTEKGVGALSSFETLPLSARVANAVVSYVTYIGKMIWPAGLAFFYPHPVAIPLWKWLGAATALGASSLWIFRMGKRHPYLPVGWLWYLGTLLPVIGLIQVGPHAMADRYAYIPMIGLSVMIAWGIPALADHVRLRAPLLAVVAVIVLAALASATWFQLGTWRNSEALFSHAIGATKNNYIAHNNLGLAYYGEGRTEEAIREYRAAIAIHPNHAYLYSNLGVALNRTGRYEEALACFQEALRRRNEGGMHHNLGIALYHLGKYEEALIHFRQAVSLGEKKADTYNFIGSALARLNRPEEAEAAFRSALEIDPQDKDANRSLEELLTIRGRR